MCVNRRSAWLSVSLNEFGSALQHFGSNEKQVESGDGGRDFSFIVAIKRSNIISGISMQSKSTVC